MNYPKFPANLAFSQNKTVVLHLFLTTDPQAYAEDVTSPLGNSDQAIIQVKYPTNSERTELPPRLRIYLSVFPCYLLL